MLESVYIASNLREIYEIKDSSIGIFLISCIFSQYLNLKWLIVQQNIFLFLILFSMELKYDNLKNLKNRVSN